MQIVIAIIGDGQRQWEEEYELNNIDSKYVKGYVQKIVDNFNETLRPRERPRKLIRIKEIVQKGIQCKGCGEDIIFITSKNGKKIPCDPKPLSLVSLAGEVIQGHMPHWATCPEADRFRRKGH